MAGNMPCYDERGMVKASPMTTCTSESPIMHRGGQGEKGGTGCKRRTGKAKAGRKAKASTGQRDNAHSPPHHTGGRSTLLYGTAASLREIPDLQIFVENVNERMRYQSLCASNVLFSIRNGGLCIAKFTQVRIPLIRIGPSKAFAAFL